MKVQCRYIHSIGKVVHHLNFVVALQDLLEAYSLAGNLSALLPHSHTEMILKETYFQRHYREVPRWEIFMEQEFRFGLDLGRLAVLKKKVWANYEQLLRVVFSCFQGQKTL